MPEVNVIAVGAVAPAANFLYTMTVFSSTAGVPGAPFSAVPDSDDSLMDRFEGRWDQVGRRQMESSQASVQDYYLWNWCNESSGKEIDYIELIPGELPVLIAAVTLSHVD